MGNEKCRRINQEIFGWNSLTGGRGIVGKLVHRSITKSTGNGR